MSDQQSGDISQVAINGLISICLVGISCLLTYIASGYLNTPENPENVSRWVGIVVALSGGVIGQRLAISSKITKSLAEIAVVIVALLIFIAGLIFFCLPFKTVLSTTIIFLSMSFLLVYSGLKLLRPT